MPEIEKQNMEQESPIQKWAPYLVLIVLGGAVAFYLTQFPNGLSDKQSVWGQFGDFVGGLVNPIIGFFTIWLLAVSLRQNHKALSQANTALKQAKAELELTREAIQQAGDLQKSTEEALQKQIEIAGHARDINNTVSILDYLMNRDSMLSKDKQHVGSDQVRSILEAKRLIRGRMSQMDSILEKERLRLIEQYTD